VEHAVLQVPQMIEAFDVVGQVGNDEDGTASIA
jgi:hypothetical protein